MMNKLLELSIKKNCKKNQNEFRIEKVIKGKGNKMSNGKVMIIHSIVGLIKRTL